MHSLHVLYAWEGAPGSLARFGAAHRRGRAGRPARPIRPGVHVSGDRKRLLVVAGLAILAVALGFGATTYLRHGAGGVARSAAQLAGSLGARVALGGRAYNILVIANNARDVAANDPLGLGDAAGQADAIVVAHLDPVAHEIDAITVPRDALVAQPGWDDPVPKIKTLFFMGDQEQPPKGPQLLAAAVERLTGLKLDGYLAANFAGFEAAIDAVGGLDIEVPQRLYDPRHSGADFAPGIHHMDGAQALAFVRVRQNEAGNDYRVNDFQRMQAEVEVIGLLRDKLLDPAHAATLVPHFVAKMKGDVATNLSDAELIRLGLAMAGAPVYQVPLATLASSMWLAPSPLPGVNSGGRIWGDYYDVLDPAAIAARLRPYGSKSSSTGLPPLPVPRSVRVALYGDPHLALHLEHLGFRVVRLGGPTQADPVSVFYPPGRPQDGWAVARAIGLGDEQVQPGSDARVVVYQ